MPTKSKPQNLSPNPSAPQFLCISMLILFIAAFFSTLALGNAHRFHPDEAFYMTFSRNAAVNGDWWMISEPVDKPPLTFYTNAISLVFLAVEADKNGVLQLDPLKGEFAGRIPSVLMSIILVAVVMALAKSLHSDNRVAYLAGLLTALSPFRIVFAATAFTDLPMLLFATISLWMAARNKSFWAAFWFIVSIWAKPQSIFYLPLIVYLLIYRMYKADTIHLTSQNLFVGTASILSARKKQLLKFTIPIFIGGFLLWGWDIARIGQGAASFFALGQSRYTATMISPLADYPVRIAEWWTTVQYLFGNGILTIIFLAIAIVGAIRRRDTISLILAGWIIAFSLAHIVLTLNLFDRNQIVLLPLAAILVATGFQTQRNRETEKFRRGRSETLPYIKVICILLLGWAYLSGISASFHQLPMGGDDGRHDGINELADYLNSKPVATVIYDTWLDWELDYYMGVWTDKRRVFYPNPELLVQDALALDERGKRYFVVPANIDETLWLEALHQAGFIITPDYEMPNFRVWELAPPQS